MKTMVIWIPTKDKRDYIVCTWWDKIIKLTSRNQEKCIRLIFPRHNMQITMDLRNMHKRDILYNDKLSETRKVQIKQNNLILSLNPENRL